MIGNHQSEDRHPIGSALDAMTGHRMPGGCDDCHAYQTIEQQTPGVYLLAVWHDNGCPELRRRSR